MVDEKSVAKFEDQHASPDIRRIRLADLGDALASGLADFNAKPSHIVLLVILYPIVALVLFRLSFGYDVLPLLFPLAAGFALIGPVAAIGLYEVSRLREIGGEVTWMNAASVLWSPSIWNILKLGGVQFVIYFVWLGAAMVIYRIFFGDAVPVSIADFARLVATTPSGWGLIAVGCSVGFFFALLVLLISVVSFPLLIDKNVSAVLAVQTSVRSVIANPIPMAAWGLIVASSLAIGSLPFFIGLAVVMPVLGHATWHLYRKVVVWER